MGAHPYWYFVPFREDLQSALDELRVREHQAGRYNPVISFLKFGEPAFSAQTPGAQHKTIAAALKASAEDGTRSILDIERIGSAPGYGVAAPAPPELLEELCGSRTPTRAALEENRSPLLSTIARGQCLYVVIADANGKPSEIFFAGYSYD